MQIRKATMNDLPDILAIYAYAREYMKEHRTSVPAAYMSVSSG